ncbi:MAG: hypothetical protein OCD76_04880 [Reichenbachiella sp.]
MKNLIFLFLLSSTCTLSIAQEVAKPSKVYKGGDIISFPTYGLVLTMPQNWKGYVTRGSGTFTMSNDTTVQATALIFVNDGDLEKTKADWLKGFELSPTLTIVTSQDPTIQNGVLSAPIEVDGNKMNKGYMMKSCGEHGYCVSVMFSVPSRYLPMFEGKLMPLIKAITYSKPEAYDPNSDFNWRKLLTGSLIFNSEREVKSQKENKIWLNYDGSFKSKTKRTGIFKGSAGKYHGTKKGYYTINNAKDGALANLELEFSKLPKLTLPLEVEDYKYYINGQIFYFSKLE